MLRQSLLKLSRSQRFHRVAALKTLSHKGDKERIVILGSGWGGFRLAKDLNKEKFEVVVVSPRNHFLFTPLLPSTTTGTLEFGCVQEPVRTIKGINYYQSKAESIDHKNKMISCRDVHHKENLRFDLPFDKLVIAVGSKAATYGIPGVQSREESDKANLTGTDRHNVFFLKQLRHARAIRDRILECFERASNPHIPESERSRLLTFVVVGGGPTSVEFTSELHDFLQYDVARWYKDLRQHVRVIIVERGKGLLGAFDSRLQEYVIKKFESRNIEIFTESQVKEVCAVSLSISRASKEGQKGSRVDSELPFGLCVWAIGNEPLDFIKKLNILTFRGRITIDDHLRIVDPSVSNRHDIFALGDCAANDKDPLGTLAQVANQQGKFLATYLNSGVDMTFRYNFLGAMAQLGTFDAVFESSSGILGESKKLKGFLAFITWRSAYWVKSVSITNKFLIPMFWFKSFCFGRDISKF